MLQPATSQDPQVYQVWVRVLPAVGGTGVLIQVLPERLLLNGNANNVIQWQMMTGSLATFTEMQDVNFGANSEFFSMSWDPEQQIIFARVNGENNNETIYTYYLSVHLNDPPGVVIQFDPEVDNPPPPPTGP
jgi:hypothetical protein